MNNKELEKSTVLLVDDKPENLDVLITYLAEFGFTILVAQEGEEAIELAQRYRPDIILLDVMMPGIDGFEVCQRLKAFENLTDIPVIFMTALSDTVDKLKGFKAGGVDYITKPLQHEEVMARVKTHLTIRMLQQQLQNKNVQLERANEQLQELIASKDKFFSIISHDLRNLFQGVLWSIELIMMNIDTYDKEEIKKWVLTLQSSSEKLYSLVENLLLWSRIQKSKMDYNPRYIDFRDIVEQNLLLFMKNAEKKNIQLISSIKEPVFIYVDNNIINVVIRNFISNALKFTEEGGSVVISAQQNKKYVTVSIKDTGIGISKENLSKLFRIDVTLKAIGTAGEQGTGLGLILCKELIEKSGGSILVESELGKGTTFTFTLPRTPVMKLG